MNANEEIVPPEEITPQAMLEHFVVNFYEMFKGDNPPGHFSRLRNDAVEGVVAKKRATAKATMPPKPK
jgi:hypothetical protein